MNNKRTEYRNGYKKRKLKTVDGELIVDKPDIRSGSFTTTVFDKYSTAEKALNSVIVESYINGVSTRSVNNIINKLGVNVSPEYVSSLNKDLDIKVKEFLETVFHNILRATMRAYRIHETYQIVLLQFDIHHRYIVKHDNRGRTYRKEVVQRCRNTLEFNIGRFPQSHVKE